MSPKEAYRYAEKHGPSDKTRKIACKDPEIAYLYARKIDKGLHENTREAVCKSYV